MILGIFMLVLCIASSEFIHQFSSLSVAIGVPWGCHWTLRNGGGLEERGTELLGGDRWRWHCPGPLNITVHIWRWHSPGPINITVQTYMVGYFGIYFEDEIFNRNRHGM